MRISDWSSDVCSSDLDGAVPAIDGVFQLVARYGAAGAFHQCQQRAVFVQAERDVGASAPYWPGGRVQRNRPARQQRGDTVVAAPEYRPQARQQLVQLERLDDVIVRPGVQAADALAELVARRDQQDGRGVVAGPQGA